MASKSIILRKWNDTPPPNSQFSFMTRFTDLGSPDGIKYILGFYVNVSQDSIIIKNISTNPQASSQIMAYSFKIFTRHSVNGNFKLLGVVSNTFSSSQINTLSNFLTKTVLLESPIPFKNVQLNIEGENISSGFGINDFGLIYRPTRESSIEKHDES